MPKDTFPVMLKGELGLQFREQGTWTWSVHGDTYPASMQVLRDIAGDRPSAIPVYEDFFFLNPLPWEVSVCF